MSEPFDPYLKWLGIRDPERPPNHYRLLGIDLFESDLDVIATAADRQMAHVRKYQSGAHSKLSQDLLNELSVARLSLLSVEKKRDYDAALERNVAKTSRRELATTPISAPVAPTRRPSSYTRDVVRAQGVKRIRKRLAGQRRRLMAGWLLVVFVSLVAACIFFVVLRRPANRKTSSLPSDTRSVPSADRDVQRDGVLSQATPIRSHVSEEGVSRQDQILPLTNTVEANDQPTPTSFVEPPASIVRGDAAETSLPIDSREATDDGERRSGSGVASNRNREEPVNDGTPSVDREPGGGDKETADTGDMDGDAATSEAATVETPRAKVPWDNLPLKQGQRPQVVEGRFKNVSLAAFTRNDIRAQRQLERIRSARVDDRKQVEARCWQMLCRELGNFWRAVDDTLSEIREDELPTIRYNGERVNIGKVTNTNITLSTGTKVPISKEFAADLENRQGIDSELAIVLATHQLGEASDRCNSAVAAFLTVDADGDLVRARELWQQVNADYLDTKEILATWPFDLPDGEAD